LRKEKQPAAPGSKFCGLILLFSTRNGEPLAIMPNGIIQRLRVACTNALGAKYMAPSSASVYGLIGSGWQASGQALAMAAVLPLREIRIYSPTQANRERLARELKAQLGIAVSRAIVDLEKLPDLGELVSGRISAPPAGVLTCFVNVMGHGIQFAALGALAYENAKARGFGREIPTDWLLESEPP
jgi:ornithine cyclodeaminase/alanine dehydrogenase-like protein (mu-crystallin family)